MATGMPVGLIGSYYKGSSAQAWMSLAALQQAPSFSGYLAQYHQIARDFSNNSEAFLKRKKNYEQELALWEAGVGAAYREELEAWKLKCKEACLKLLAQPLKPNPLSGKPTTPFSPDGDGTTPTMVFNAMIAPLIPYAISGVIWYQGESNENRESPHSWMPQSASSSCDTSLFSAFEYRRLFQRLIRSWRAAWGEGPFPFYFVSLAGFRNSTLDPVEMLFDDEGSRNPCWAWLREGQAVALALPETGMAVAVDLGNPNDIHPKDKLDVGRRLALLARKNLYGQQLAASGPTYHSWKQEGKTIRLNFDHLGRGLIVAAPPWRYDGAIVMPHALQGFAIAGDDRHWYEASAIIEGSNVIVSSEFVKKPTAVRYNWKDNPTGNLYNKEGLPAAPFRTDLDEPR
jgi:sialate O-acetylesterase